MTRWRLGRLVMDDGHDAEYRDSYVASGQAAPVRDYSSEYDFRGWSDADLAREERWTLYYVQSNLRPGEVHRLRAIHQEQQRRRQAGES